MRKKNDWFGATSAKIKKKFRLKQNGKREKKTARSTLTNNNNLKMIIAWTKSVFGFCAINICGATMYWVLIIIFSAYTHSSVKCNAMQRTATATRALNVSWHDFQCLSTLWLFVALYFPTRFAFGIDLHAANKSAA